MRTSIGTQCVKTSVGKITVVQRPFDLRSQDLEFEPVEQLHLAGDAAHGRGTIQRQPGSVVARPCRFCVAFVQIDEAKRDLVEHSCIVPGQSLRLLEGATGCFHVTSTEGSHSLRMSVPGDLRFLCSRRGSPTPR